MRPVDDALPAAPRGPIYFSSRRASSGIDFTHVSGDGPEKPFPAANGSGIAVIDYDCDGRCDLYFATGNPFPVDHSGGDATNRFYRNLGGWQFADRTVETGLGHNGFSAGLAVGDFNEDGFRDVYVACYGDNVLYQNQGDGTFLNVSAASGAADDRWATSAAFLDYDGDGLLDLYVGNYAQWTMETNQFCGDRERGYRIFCSPRMVPPEDDVLYHNEGDGTFVDVSAASGVNARPARTQGVLAADLDQDGWVDLYLGNDLNPNSLLINQRDGTFVDDGELAGAAYGRSGMAQAGMGVATADADRNGTFELFVTNYANEHNAYYENRAGIFQETSHLRGLAAVSLPWIGWGTAFADFDLDGWHDLVVVNGHTDDNLADVGREGDYAQPAHVWHGNRGTFELAASGAGPYFQEPHPGRSLALADFDNDLDWDVVCGHQDAPPELLCNERADSSRAPAIRLRLLGVTAPRDAIGTVVTWSRDDRTIVEQVVGGGSYLSSSESDVLIATGDVEADSGMLFNVRWPAGGESTAGPLRPGGGYVIIEPHTRGQSPCRILEIGQRSPR